MLLNVLAPFGEDDWRSHWAVITNAYCPVRAGEDTDTTALDSRLASIAGRYTSRHG